MPGPARLVGFERHTIENIAVMTTPRPAASAQPGSVLALVVLVWGG
ncbi:MAG: hypothetical protein LC749_20260 [Actinobacteria bacterium]|nr:hypothetical protein [Actinomycetota bacterium]